MNLLDLFRKPTSPNLGDPTGYMNAPPIPGPDPYSDYHVAYSLPAGHGDPDASTGGGNATQAQNRRNILTIGGGDIGWYNAGLGCFRAAHYGERQLPGRRYVCYSPPRAFSGWLR